MVFVNRSYGFDCDFPPIDGPRAPLADVLEIEDYCIDGSCYVLADNNQVKNADSMALNGELASETEEEENPETLTASNAEPIIEAQYEDDEDDSDNEEDDEIIEIDDDEEEEEEEEEEDDDEETYPELSKKRKGSKPVAEDSYDFSVMDTDKDSGRKRKTPGKGVADKKKKAKK